jgi:uncharacterized protein (TIGR02996 family)
MTLLTDTEEGRALLDRVVAEPDDDTVRLAADWLAERGEADRAAFVRLQVGLRPVVAARWRGVRCTGVSAVWCPACGDCACPDREVRMDAPHCPLHASDSPHARPAAVLRECRRLFRAGQVDRATRLEVFGAEQVVPWYRFRFAGGFPEGFIAGPTAFEILALEDGRVFTRAPIRNVVLRGCRPHPSETDYGTGTVRPCWDWWVDAREVPVPPRSRLPRVVLDGVLDVVAAAPMAGYRAAGVYIPAIDRASYCEFPSEGAALRALDLACVRLGRVAAGLKPPPIPLVPA